MKIVDILPVERIKIPLGYRSKEEIITEMVELISSSGKDIDFPNVLKSILNRERTMSTGIGGGVAIPHGKSSGVQEVTASFGVIPEGVDFESLDGEPVYLFFLIASPEGPAGPHLKTLSLISRLIEQDSIKKKLLQATTPEEAYTILAEGEAQL